MRLDFWLPFQLAKVAPPSYTKQCRSRPCSSTTTLALATDFRAHRHSTIFDFVESEGWLVLTTFDIFGVGIPDTPALFSELSAPSPSCPFIPRRLQVAISTFPRRTAVLGALWHEGGLHDNPSSRGLIVDIVRIAASRSHRKAPGKQFSNRHASYRAADWMQSGMP